MIRLVLAALLLPAIAQAQPPGARDPDWPCQQIKVPEMSLASVWSGPPLEPHDASWRDDPAVAELVPRLASRREPLDHAASLIHDFAQSTGDRKQGELLKVLAGLLDVLNQERDAVMAGLDRFGGRQKDLAADIRADNEKLRALQTDSGADPKAVERMTQQVTWKAEMFQDRRQAIGYACEVPGKIEKRLFALARQIQQALD